MTLRELGNSIVQFVVDVYFHFYDTLVKANKLHFYDLEIKDIFTVILLFILIYGTIHYLYQITFEPLIEKICEKIGYDYNKYDNGYVVYIIFLLTFSILIYLIEFLIPSYQ